MYKIFAYLFEHPGEYGDQIRLVFILDDGQYVIKVPAHDHQTIHEYGYFFNGLLLQFPFRFANISGYNDEFTDGGQEFIREAAQVGTTIRLNLVPHRAIFRLKV